MFKIEENETTKKEMIDMYWRMGGGHEIKMASIRAFWNELSEQNKVLVTNQLGTNLPDFIEANRCNEKFI